MSNLTLTIIASPELLAAMTSFTSAITAAKVISAPPTNQGTAAVKTLAQTYTFEQLAAAATEIVDSGRRAELVSLLSSFDVQALTALPKEQYGAFAAQLRELGSKI
jgi:hypothetical protein